METLPSGLPKHVADKEALARFLFQSSHFNSLGVKPAAFLPNPKDKETSVSRHEREPAERLWAIARSAAGERKLYGAALVKAGTIRRISLEIESSEPPPRHAAIKSWPWDETDHALQKAKQKKLAAQLAEAAGDPVLL